MACNPIQIRSSDLCVVIAALAASTTVMAGGTPLQLVTQARQLVGDSNVLQLPDADQDIQNIDAEGTEAFTVVLDTYAAIPAAYASFHATQDSHIAPFGVRGVGSASSSFESFDPDALVYNVGWSIVYVTFEVATDAPFRLIAELGAAAVGGSSLKLIGGQRVIVNMETTEKSEIVRMEGTLPPGHYTLECAAFSSGSNSVVDSATEEVEFTLHFSTSAYPADLDNDGVVTSADLALLLGAWGPCVACAADLNADGSVDAGDLGLLLGSWR